MFEGSTTHIHAYRPTNEHISMSHYLNVAEGAGNSAGEVYIRATHFLLARNAVLAYTLTRQLTDWCVWHIYNNLCLAQQVSFDVFCLLGLRVRIIRLWIRAPLPHCCRRFAIH